MLPNTIKGMLYKRVDITHLLSMILTQKIVDGQI